MQPRVRPLDALVLSCALALGGTAMAAAGALESDAEVRQPGPSQQPMRVAQRPEVRKSSKTTKSSDHPGYKGPKAKKSSEVSQIVCEGGQIKTASNGVRGCSCGLNVRRVLVAKNHFRCDRPQVRKSSKTTKSSDLPGHKGPRAKKSSDVKKEPGSTGRPIQKQTSTGKPVSGCRATLTATRHGAVTRGTGLATAVAAWEQGAKKAHGFHMGSWKRAQDKASNCSRGAALWKCTVSARPCPPS